MANEFDPQRRHVVVAGAGMVTAALTAPAGATVGLSAADKVVVGIMGLSRGRELAQRFAKQPNIEVKYVCDVDSERAGTGAEAVRKLGGSPQEIGDFRKILDDKDVDALVCAAPNHWHAPATILGCAAGKHVYVEKPCSHTPQEGEWAVAAARKHNRTVQMGAQRRSSPTMRDAIRFLHEGGIGRVYHTRSWYSNSRQSIGRGKRTEPPKNLDFAMWQGPCRHQRYVDNLVPYNWHWRWHWGNGELGNNGVHALDICRWGLGVDYPTRVVSSGGRYRFHDDQETPDTHLVSFEFGDRKSISWEGLSCNPQPPGFVTFYGETGTVAIDGNCGYVIYDTKGKVVKTVKGVAGDDPHIANFLAAIRDDKPLSANCEILDGHKATLLCHLGNIAHRSGRSLTCTASDGHIMGEPIAAALWSKEYEKEWEPKV